MVDMLDLSNDSRQHSKSKRLSICDLFPSTQTPNFYQLSSSAEPGLNIPDMSPS